MPDSFLGLIYAPNARLPFPRHPDSFHSDSVRFPKPDVRYFESSFTQIERHFSDDEEVFVRSYRTRRKWIPGVIVRKVGGVNYDVKIGNKIVKRHVDQIIRNKTNDKEISGSRDDYEFHDYSFNDEAGPRPCVTGQSQRRYPVRNRRPINRFGYS